MLLKQAYENAQSELAVMLGLPIPESSVTRFDRLIPETSLDELRELRGDRASRARRRRKYQTLEPGTVPGESYVPLEGWLKVRLGLWQFSNWLTKEKARLTCRIASGRHAGGTGENTETATDAVYSFRHECVLQP